MSATDDDDDDDDDDIDMSAGLRLHSPEIWGFGTGWGNRNHF